MVIDEVYKGDGRLVVINTKASSTTQNYTDTLSNLSYIVVGEGFQKCPKQGFCASRTTFLDEHQNHKYLPSVMIVFMRKNLLIQEPPQSSSSPNLRLSLFR